MGWESVQTVTQSEVTSVYLESPCPSPLLHASGPCCHALRHSGFILGWICHFA